jgi:hypothetical protein
MLARKRAFRGGRSAGLDAGQQAAQPGLQHLIVIVLRYRLDEATIARPLELMILSGSASARGIIASPFVFASTSSRSAS